MKTHVLVATILTAIASGFAEDISVSVNGMVCAFCAQGIEKKLKAVPSVESVHVDLEKKLVQVSTKKGQTLDDAQIKKIIGDAGYSIETIQRGGAKPNESK